jgi:hypothetical protein
MRAPRRQHPGSGDVEPPSTLEWGEAAPVSIR